MEKAVKAKTILLFGTSLGGGAHFEAIQNHQFNKEIYYNLEPSNFWQTLHLHDRIHA